MRPLGFTLSMGKLACTVAVSHQSSAQNNRLQGSMVDDKTGQPVAARLHAADEPTGDLQLSSWVAARVADDPDNKNRILPRGLSVLAHTNAVYFLVNGTQVREEASIRYLERYVRGTIHWLKTGPPFANPADRDEAIRHAEKALAFYRGL
jgi:hypothetical protein